MGNIKPSNIPNRLRNVSAEHPYVAGAVDIVDDALGKPQSQVNQERIQEENTLDGKIATEKQRAEGIESGLEGRLETVEGLAEISVGGGDIQIATGADFDSPDATKRAKAVTVGAMLDGMINSPVFDLSAYTGDSYASLDAALTVMNAAGFPSQLKKGGMTLKFVQSSDNIYVQFRYMGTEVTGTPNPFLDTNNWQQYADLKDVFGAATYNVSELHPTGGTDGTNVYTHGTAIATIPNEYRKGGMFICYLCNFGTEESPNVGWVFEKYTAQEYVQSDYLYAPESWIKENVKHFINVNRERNKADAYNSAGSARNAVPYFYRFNPNGLMIEFLLSDGWHVQQCISDTWSAGAGAWKDFPDNTEIVNKLNVTFNKVADAETPTIVSRTSSVASGSKFATLNSFTTVQKDSLGLLTITGLSGRIAFYNSSWTQIASYFFSNGVGKEIVVPANCPNVRVWNANDAVAGSDIPFTLSLIVNSLKQNVEDIKANIRGYGDYKQLINYDLILSQGSHNVTLAQNLPSAYNLKKVLAKLDGFDGVIGFTNSDYSFTVDRYGLENGKWTEIIVPYGYEHILLSTADGGNVPQDTPYSLQILGNTLELALNEEFNNEVVIFDKTGVISAGSYRDTTNFRTTALVKPVKGKIRLTGISGSVIFYTSAWVSSFTYELTDGEEKEITIPSRCPYIVVSVGTAVSSEKKFSLKLTYIEKDLERYNTARFLNDEDKYVPVLQNLHLTAINKSTNYPDTRYKTLVLASITDIHNNPEAAVPVLSFIRKYKGYFDDVVGMGDYVDGSLATPLAISSIDGWGDIIKAIGNHDAYEDWEQYGSSHVVSEQVCYETFMEDDISGWDVVKPSGYHTYFYKDYDDAKIRVVWLDYMHWNVNGDTGQQETWLRDILLGEHDYADNALDKNYQVIIIRHDVPKSTLSGDFIPFENSTFNTQDSQLTITENTSEPDIVDNFIQAGGVFVCWMCGHRHQSFTGAYQNYANQIIIVQPCSAAFKYGRDSVYTWDTQYQQNLFVFGFDSSKKFIRVYNCGAIYNRNLQHQESMLIRYGSEQGDVKLLACY